MSVLLSTAATALTSPAMASLDRLWHHGTPPPPTYPFPATPNAPNTHQLGYTSDLALLDVKDSHGITGLAWRLMMASAALPAVVACLLVYLGPESPRWFLTRGQHADAYAAMSRLRNTKVQAARDLFQAHVLLKAEMGAEKGGSKVREMFTIRRNRNALLASEILMVMQQFSGVNVSFPSMDVVWVVYGTGMSRSRGGASEGLRHCGFYWTVLMSDRLLRTTHPRSSSRPTFRFATRTWHRLASASSTLSLRYQHFIPLTLLAGGTSC